jgi:hypothetical protein
MQYSEDIISLAQKMAKEMLQTTEETRKFQFGHDSGFLWISRRRDKLIAITEIQVDGVIFYLGLMEGER